MLNDVADASVYVRIKLWTPMLNGIHVHRVEIYEVMQQFEKKERNEIYDIS